MAASEVRIGTAGWSIPRAMAERFPGTGSHLARYSQVLNCAEINTSFYRSHRPEVYARWAAQTPPGFQFSVKLPRTITHEHRLRDSRALLMRFLDEVAGLADRLDVLLVQLPPSLVFEPRLARRFFEMLSSKFDGSVVCEARHSSWMEPSADRLMVKLHIGRVGSDPAISPVAALPGGWLGPNGDGMGAVVYQRWHGSPRTYYSSYANGWLDARASEIKGHLEASTAWCIFDNTAAGAATADALRLRAYVDQ